MGGESEAHQQSLQAIQRVGNLPLVTSAFSAYDAVKANSPVLRRSFSAAEAAIRLAWGGASPILVSSLGDRLAYVDKMACHGLDYVETTVPAIKQPPQEIYTSTRNYLEGQVQSGLAYGFGTLDAGLNVADSAVDKILPPGQGEGAQAGFTGEGGENKSGREVVQHAVVIGEKVRHRLTRASLGRIQELRATSTAALLRLREALETLATQAKAGVRRGSDAALKSSEKLPPQILQLAQALLDSMTKTADFAQRYLPANYQTQFVTMKEYATNIYCQLSLDTSAAATSGLKRAREQLAHLQEMLNNSVHVVFETTGLSRFLKPSLPTAVNGVPQKPTANGQTPSAEHQ